MLAILLLLSAATAAVVVGGGVGVKIESSYTYTPVLVVIFL